MSRFSVSLLALSWSVLLLLLLTACGSGNNPGASSQAGPPATVSLSPHSVVSLNAGDTLQMQASVLDAQQRAVFNQTITFTSSDPRVQIANNGLLCGGTWNSVSTPTVCAAANVGPAGIQANISANVGGIASNVVVASIHLQVTSVSVSPRSPACVSQGGTVHYTAQAFSGATDITSSVGAFTWRVLDGVVASVSPAATTGSTPSAVTAKFPGQTQVGASVNTVSQVEGLTIFEECGVESITITPSPVSFGNVGVTQQMTASLVDTNGTTLANPPPITWSSNLSAVASLTSTGLLSAMAPGTTSIVASCIPNACNTNLGQHIFSASVQVKVAGTSSTTVYVAGPSGVGRGKLIPIPTQTNVPGIAIDLPAAPNSLRFNPVGTRAYLGSLDGLMIVDATQDTFITTISTARGKVLAVSPNGQFTIVAEDPADFPSQIFLFDQNAGSVTPLAIAGAVAADFTPDSTKAYVVSGSNLFVLKPGDANREISLPGPGTDVSVLSSGSLAFIPFSAAVPGTAVLATCADHALMPFFAEQWVKARSTTDGGTLIRGAGGGIGLTIGLNSTPGCPPANVPAGTSIFDLGTLGVTIKDLLVTPDISRAYITYANPPSGGPTFFNLPFVNLVSTDEHFGPGQILLPGFAAPSSIGNGITPDSKTLYVGAPDNKTVHRIDLASDTHLQAIPVSVPPLFVAVRPH